MVDSSDEPSLLDRIRSSARRAKAHASRSQIGASGQRPPLPLSTASATNQPEKSIPLNDVSTGVDNRKRTATRGSIHASTEAGGTASRLPPPAPPPAEEGDGETSSTIGSAGRPNIGIRFYNVMKETLLSSYFNVLLIFVPVGIAVQAAGINPTIVFAMNAIAIVPLAGLLSHATESVAAEMGDTVGALMNVTFGNAVELIIL